MTSNDLARPVRIAHVIQNLNYGGMERVLHSLAQRLPGQGFEVHVIVLQYLGRFAHGLDDTVCLHQVPPMPRLSFFHPSALITKILEIAPDVVHSHTGVWFKASRAARVAGVPVMVHTEHGRPDPVRLTDRLIDNRASRLTDTVIAVSEALAQVLRRQVVHEPARVRVITNGVDIDSLRPAVDRSALRDELGIPTDAFVIGSIGRLEPVKNYPLALRAFARLREAPGAHDPYLILVGDGSQRVALEELARSLGIAPRVKFLGWRLDAERIYGAFDVFTLTSTSEGTSISLLEAMSTGVCPIVTDVGGNRAVLGPDLEELLVPSNDDFGMAQAWQRAMADVTIRLEMGARSRDRVVTAFSLERMVDLHSGLYRDLLARSRR